MFRAKRKQTQKQQEQGSDSVEEKQNHGKEKKEDSAKSHVQTSHLVVSAIDFGTTFTGYAYAFKSEPEKVFTSRWKVPDTQGYSEKAPTNVLLNPDKTFHSFGYDAQLKYQELLEDNEYNGWYFFERFKMKLYETKPLRRDAMLADVSGKYLLAADIFEKVIRHIKDKAEKEMISTCGGMKDDDILWVITVPAIWSDSAKQFMREAGIKAGIPSERLKLALEPEAAAVYVNRQRMCKVRKIDGSEVFEEFPEGHKYIVADLGGGTADLSAHEILSDNNIRELHSANGGACGGILVDKAFRLFVDELFGEIVMKQLEENYQENMFQLLMSFETKKKNFQCQKQGDMRIAIPRAELNEIVNKDGSSFSEITERISKLFGDSVEFRRDKMILKHEIMERFFNKVVDEIIQFIASMLKDQEKEMINTLVLVGGFSESQYVQERIQRKFRGMRMITPPDPSLAVLKGAVMIGFKPNCILERMAKFSYGFGFAQPFVQGEHPERLKVKQGDEWLCSSVFDKFVTKGQILKGGESYFTLSRYTPSSFLGLFAPVATPIYKSSSTDPTYTDEQNCELIGEFIIHPPGGVWPPLTVFIKGVIVGETELTVHAINTSSLEILEAKIDFLSSSNAMTQASKLFSPATSE